MVEKKHTYIKVFGCYKLQYNAFDLRNPAALLISSENAPIFRCSLCI